jgi:pimeloyl-ACP methyl ester carboxylesterase
VPHNFPPYADAVTARQDPERLAVDVPGHPGAVLRVEVHHGRAARTALFSSGLGLPLDLWHPVVDLLPDVRCILVDRPGMGGSTPWHRVVDLVEEVGLLETVLDAVHPEAARDPVVVVGHSQGGLYAEGLARTRPEAVRAVVLVDPADPEQEASRRLQLEGWQARLARRLVGHPRTAPATAGIAALSVLAGGSLTGQPARVLEGADASSLPVLTRLVRGRHRLHGVDDTLVHAHEALVRAYEQPDQLDATVAELAAVREDALGLLELARRSPMPPVPVELVVATRGTWPGHRVRRAWLRLMAGRASHLGTPTTRTHADSGHLVMLDAPELLAEVLRRATLAAAALPAPDLRTA